MALIGVVFPRVVSVLRGRIWTTVLARPTRLATVLRYSISCSFSSCGNLVDTRIQYITESVKTQSLSPSKTSLSSIHKTPALSLKWIIFKIKQNTLSNAISEIRTRSWYLLQALNLNGRIFLPSSKRCSLHNNLLHHIIKLL